MRGRGSRGPECDRRRGISFTRGRALAAASPEADGTVSAASPGSFLCVSPAAPAAHQAALDGPSFLKEHGVEMNRRDTTGLSIGCRGPRRGVSLGGDGPLGSLGAACVDDDVHKGQSVGAASPGWARARPTGGTADSCPVTWSGGCGSGGPGLGLQGGLGQGCTLKR